MDKEKIIIIGGGLSGLTLASLFSKNNIKYTLLEASSRLGGRIQTIHGHLDTPMELGATWFSDVHSNLINLLSELKLKKYRQYAKGKSLFQTKSFEPPQEFYVPESQESSYRIYGGTQALIKALQFNIEEANIQLHTKVTAISLLTNGVSVETSNKQSLLADKVILCMPPQLVGSQIKFIPSLPETVLEILPTVHTWMAGSIKFVLEYKTPFWRQYGYSGMLYSHSGIVTEMYDHSNMEENKFGFTGFLNSSASAYSNVLREELVIGQLESLLGKEAATYVSYVDKVWTNEFIQNENQIIQRPHQNNGHPIFKDPYLNKTVYFSGTETSNEFSGYMEGAIIAAKTICSKILSE